MYHLIYFRCRLQWFKIPSLVIEIWWGPQIVDRMATVSKKTKRLIHEIVSIIHYLAKKYIYLYLNT